ncbi:hypothetical protein MCUN1_000349 [Malassezia cuniculi]|uniref:Uncharacterized protein n=1 Tax=Malassezia cuniculi TaxID=948313 RepID=A0AAF0ES69_9BASI|nr:hypothetical protein MCUN1_000349 [Malassezia cuniculi]
MLRRSTRSRTADEPDTKRQRTSLPELQLSAEDAQRLRNVVHITSPQLLDEPKEQPLRALLDRPASLSDVWHAVNSLLPVHAARPSAHGHGALLLLRHMLAELAKSTNVDEEPAQGARGAYALHMRLPAGDYFTSAAFLSDAERDALKTGGADLVAVAPDLATRPYVPTLGDRAPARPEAEKKTKARTDEQVLSTFLSYGAYGSSLGPTHDSTGSTLSHEMSARVWRSQRRFMRELNRRWGRQFAQDVDSALRQVTSGGGNSSGSDQVPTGAEIAADMAKLDSSLDASVLGDAIEELDASYAFDDIIADNWDILRELQDVQWLRTRTTYTGGKPAPTPAALAAYEQILADELLASLTQLMLAKHPSTPRDTPPPPPPRPLLLASMAALSTSVTRPMPGYYGTLDGRTYAPKTSAQLDVQAGTPVPPPVRTTWAGIARPTVLADNFVAHWTPGAPPGKLSAKAADHAGTPGDLAGAYPGAPPHARQFAYARPPVPSYGAPSPQAYAATRSGRPVVRPGGL